MFYDFVIWAAEIPTILYYVFVCGLVGFIASLVMPVKLKKYSIVFAMVAAVLLRNIILPSIDKFAFEAGFIRSFGELPIRLDELTTLNSVSFADGKALRVHSLSAHIDDVNEARDIILGVLRDEGACDRFNIASSKGYITSDTYQYITDNMTVTVVLDNTAC